MKTLQLLQLKRLKSSGGTGDQDVYFVVETVNKEGTKITIPTKPDNKNSWGLKNGELVKFQPESELDNGDIINGKKLTFDLDEDLSISIYDSDNPDKPIKDDFLGTTIVSNDAPLTAQTTVSMKIEGEEVEYELTYEIVEL